ERLARRTQRVVVLDEPLELLPGARDERVRAAGLGLVQRLDRELEAAGKLVDVREPAALCVEARRLAVLEREPLELGGLKAQQLELRAPLHVAAFRLLEPRVCVLPCPVSGRDFARELPEPAVRIEQRALVRALEQRLMRVLTVNIDEQRADAPEVRERDRLIVHEGLRAALGADDPPQRAALLVIEAELLEPRERGVTGRAFEQHADLGPLRAVTDDARVRPVAEREAERVDEDRLAGPGLAGDDGQAVAELDLDLVDHGEILDPDQAQHRTRSSAAPATRPDVSGLTAREAVRPLSPRWALGMRLIASAASGRSG